MRRFFCVFAVTLVLMSVLVVSVSASDLGTVYVSPSDYDGLDIDGVSINTIVHSSEGIDRSGEHADTAFVWEYDISEGSIFYFDFGEDFEVVIRLYQYCYNRTYAKQIYYRKVTCSSGTFDFTNVAGQAKASFSFVKDTQPANSRVTMIEYPFLSDEDIFAKCQSFGRYIAYQRIETDDGNLLRSYLAGVAYGRNVETSTEYQQAFDSAYDASSATYNADLAAQQQAWSDSLAAQAAAAEADKAAAVQATLESAEYKVLFDQGVAGQLTKASMKEKITSMFSSLKASTDHVLDNIRVASISLRAIVVSVIIIGAFLVVYKVVRK